MDVVKKQMIQKLLVGHFIEDIPEDCKKRVSYVWQGNGIWEVRKLPLGIFVNHIHKFAVPGLKQTLEEGWSLNVPKIPATLLDITLSFFRQIYSKHSSEVFLQYFYDMEKEEYIVHCPQQTVGPGSVNYRRDTDYEKGKLLVFEIHSHGGMGAFFSGTDDNDEKDDRFFGVIGHVKEYYPELKLRMSIGGRRKDIDVGDIFNLDESSYNTESFPSEWANRIKEKKVKLVERSFPRVRNAGRNGGVYYPADDDYPGDGGFPSHRSFNRRYGPRQGISGESLYEQLSMLDDENQINNRNVESGLQTPGPNIIDPWVRRDASRCCGNAPYTDDDILAEELEMVTGIRDDQKLVEKDGKIYVVTDAGDEEIWEQIDTVEKEEVDNGQLGQSSGQGAEDADAHALEIIGHWRDIKW